MKSRNFFNNPIVLIITLIIIIISIVLVESSTPKPYTKREIVKIVRDSFETKYKLFRTDKSDAHDSNGPYTYYFRDSSDFVFSVSTVYSGEFFPSKKWASNYYHRKYTVAKDKIDDILDKSEFEHSTLNGSILININSLEDIPILSKTLYNVYNAFNMDKPKERKTSSPIISTDVLINIECPYYSESTEDNSQNILITITLKYGYSEEDIEKILRSEFNKQMPRTSSFHSRGLSNVVSNDFNDFTVVN